MKRSLALVTLVVLAFAAISAAAQQKPRIAVIKVENKSPYGGENLGPALEDWLVQGLVQSGKFRVMERKDLDSVLSEQSLSLSGAVDEKTAVQVGKLLGCQLVILGAITDFSKHKTEAHGLFKLGFDVGKTTAEGTVNIKLINTTTAEIVYTGQEKGSHSFANVSVASFGGGVEWDESQARQIFEPAVTRLVSAIVQKAGDIQESLGSAGALSGKVAKVGDGKVYISLGSIDGVKAGDTMTLTRIGETITDPDTGKVLGQEKTSLGTFTVTKVVGDHLAIGVANSSVHPQVGDVVEKQ
jgi:curli biogenesis system outer membrane secretion channel CsgG